MLQEGLFDVAFIEAEECLDRREVACPQGSKGGDIAGLLGAVDIDFGLVEVDANEAMAGVFFAFTQAQKGDDVFEEVVTVAMLKDQPGLIIESLDRFALRQVVGALTTGDVLDDVLDDVV